MKAPQFLQFLLVTSLFILISCSENPYKILGLDKSSTLQDIRKAYKRLAKEWHPDKSNDPDAETKFVEIKKAYELLADSERRKAYDLHGITNEDATAYRDRPDYSHYSRFSTDPFEEFFNSQRFHFHDQDISIFHKLSITTKYYETNVLVKSAKTPHILMFYSDWCFSCMKTAGAFKKLIDTLEPLGIVFGAINIGHENHLTRKIGIHSLPCMSLVLDGHNYIYKDNIYSVQKVVDFIRLKLPYKTIKNVYDNNFDQFLNSWTDNKVRALIMEPRNTPRLRYLLTAYHFQDAVEFGFVHLNIKDTRKIQERFMVNPSLDTFLMFNEDASRPVASVAMADISTQTLNSIISSNKYLALPRLSSQTILEGVCPAEWNRPRKKLCVILVTENTNAHDNARHVLRKIALESGYSSDRVRFAYIYQEKQLEFVSTLSSEGATKDTLLRIVVIWRRDANHVKYEWVHGITFNNIGNVGTPENESAAATINNTKTKLDDTIQRLLRASEALSYEAEVKDLLDEHAQSLVWRIVNKFFLTFEYFMDNLGEEHVLPVLSVIGTVLFIVVVGYFMAYLVKKEEESIQAKQNQANNNNNETGKGNSDVINYVPELKLHELRAEKYNGLVRLLKPGCRTILLLTDLQSRAKLIPVYHKAVWPYRRNKTLMFAHMLIDKGATWYAELLRLSLSESRDLNINPRNCVGTVLALNGHRKYFCMYHAKHPESNRGAKRMIKMTRQLSGFPQDPEAGAFLGMESENSDCSDSSMSEPKVLLEGNLLDGLSNWLDRLFEGTTHRYYINYWPDFNSK